MVPTAMRRASEIGSPWTGVQRLSGISKEGGKEGGKKAEFLAESVVSPFFRERCSLCQLFQGPVFISRETILPFNCDPLARLYLLFDYKQ